MSAYECGPDAGQLPSNVRSSSSPSRLQDLAAADEAAELAHLALFKRVARALEPDAPAGDFNEAVRIANMMGRGEGARAARAALSVSLDGIFLQRLEQYPPQHAVEPHALLNDLYAALSTLFAG